ncbi:hypothetical protein FGO68_gene15 [Halteria grandinella]|uniref:Uncharacterized protein n=1 Tax=Halteria grandinella TaxID=5974 RepID=A0A8J8P3K5_HALGN|nr:hypothetical protein FGO68_gene15 [Halteria grandinella]
MALNYLDQQQPNQNYRPQKPLTPSVQILGLNNGGGSALNPAPHGGVSINRTFTSKKTNGANVQPAAVFNLSQGTGEIFFDKRPNGTMGAQSASVLLLQPPPQQNKSNKYAYHDVNRDIQIDEVTGADEQTSMPTQEIKYSRRQIPFFFSEGIRTDGQGNTLCQDPLEYLQGDMTPLASECLLEFQATPKSTAKGGLYNMQNTPPPPISIGGASPINGVQYGMGTIDANDKTTLDYMNNNDFTLIHADGQGGGMSSLDAGAAGGGNILGTLMTQHNQEGDKQEQNEGHYEDQNGDEDQRGQHGENGGAAEEQDVRRDRNGNRIILTHNFDLPKRRSKHKIVFRDEFIEGQSIADVNLVESYKKYNSMMLEDDPVCACNCHIF